MSEDDISRVMASVWTAVGSEHADPKDEVLFELYRQREIYRDGLERIARYPYRGWTQQVAESTLATVTQPPGQVSILNKAVEAAVNRGLAAAMVQDDVRAGAEIMCKAGVPLGVSRRVLLDPASRRTTDWHKANEAASSGTDRRRNRPLSERQAASS